MAQGEKHQGGHVSLTERWDLSKVLKVMAEKEFK